MLSLVRFKPVSLLKCCNSEVLPVQEVVFVKVSDTSSNFTGHPLQLQQLSISEHPILLRQIATQIPLQTHTQIKQPAVLAHRKQA